MEQLLLFVHETAGESRCRHVNRCHLSALARARGPEQDHDLARLESSLVQEPHEERLLFAALSSIVLSFLQLSCDGGLDPV